MTTKTTHDCSGALAHFRTAKQLAREAACARRWALLACSSHGREAQLRHARNFAHWARLELNLALAGSR